MEAPRTLWSTKVSRISVVYMGGFAENNPLVRKLTNGHLQDRAAAFGTGILRIGLQPQKSNVLLLLNDCLGTKVSL